MSVIMHNTLQNYGTGDELALALTQYSGSIVKSYYDNLVMGRHVWRMPITGGSTYQFPAIAKASGSDVVPGVLRVGANQPEMENRTVSLDLKEFASDEYQSLTDQFIKHFDTTAAYGEAHGKACATEIEGRLLRALIIGARLAARGTGVDAFPAGSSVTSDTATSTTVIATNYPISLSGSIALQADLDKLAYTFDTKNVPAEGRVAFLSYYLKRVLLQDKTLLSADYQNSNDMLTRRMIQCAGFNIEFTNLIPHDTLAECTAAYPSQYAVASNAASGYTVCLAVGGKDAVGQITALGDVRPINPVWYENLNAWFLGAKIWQGGKWIRPEACGEIRLQG